MFKKRHPSAGARPGTLMIPEDAVPTKIRLMEYSRDTVREEDVEQVDEIANNLSDETVTWIDVQGLRDVEVLQALFGMFDVHPLAREDVVNIPQRPKTELYGDQQSIICRVVRSVGRNAIEYEQVSVILGPNYVITLQEHYSDLLEPIHRRALSETTRLRQSGADYLAYAVLDTVVDAYYPVLESIGEQLEWLEEFVVERPEPKLLRRLNSLRSRLANLRRAVWPKKELIRSLIHDEGPLIGDEVRLFLRDTYDHAIQVSDITEMCREMITGLLNTYLSAVGQRTNEVMKVLTILSSIFVPLTFLAGIYGMNFEHMPELSSKWGYPAVWIMMLASASGMLFYFRRKGWLSRSPGETWPDWNESKTSMRVVQGSHMELPAIKPMEAKADDVPAADRQPANSMAKRAVSGIRRRAS